MLASESRLYRINPSMFDNAHTSSSSSSLLYATQEAFVANTPRIHPIPLSTDRPRGNAGAVLRPPPGFGRTTPASSTVNPRKRSQRPPLTRNYPVARRPPPPPPRRPTPIASATSYIHDISNPFDSPADIEQVQSLNPFSSPKLNSELELDPPEYGRTSPASVTSMTAYLPQGLMIQLHEDDFQIRRELAERERLSRWRIVAGMLLNRGGVRPLTRKPLYMPKTYVRSGLANVMSAEA